MLCSLLPHLWMREDLGLETGFRFQLLFLFNSVLLYQFFLLSFVHLGVFVQSCAYLLTSCQIGPVTSCVLWSWTIAKSKSFSRMIWYLTSSLSYGLHHLLLSRKLLRLKNILLHSVVKLVLSELWAVIHILWLIDSTPIPWCSTSISVGFRKSIRATHRRICFLITLSYDFRSKGLMFSIVLNFTWASSKSLVPLGSMEFILVVGERSIIIYVLFAIISGLWLQLVAIWVLRISICLIYLLFWLIYFIIFYVLPDLMFKSSCCFFAKAISNCEFISNVSWVITSQNSDYLVVAGTHIYRNSQ